MKSYGSMFRVAAIAAVAMLLNAGVASGTVFRQHVDPPIYFGDGFFDVSSGCILAGTGNVTVDGVTCTVDILDLLITATDLSGTIRFAGPMPGPPVLHNEVTQLDWVDGVVVGIDSNVLDSIAQTGSFNNPGGYTLQYFASDKSVSVQCVPSESVSLSFSSLDIDDVGDPGNCSGLSVLGMQEPFVPVPEPGSLALMFGALGAGWFARRKSRKA